ncbi:hypothetical protein D3C72_916950 [compost metagenome]
MFRSPLFSTSTTSVGSAQSFQRCAMVINSLMPNICIAPSPTSATTGRPGWASLAARAYGTPQPMLASPPDTDPIMPSRNCTSRAYQLAADPESQVTMQCSGRRLDNSRNGRWGLTPLALTMARATTVSRQRDTRFSMPFTQRSDALGSSLGSKACKVRRASPTRPTSTG